MGRLGWEGPCSGGDGAEVQCGALTVPVPQEYLLNEGNLSQPATNLLGDVMSKDRFFHRSFLEALRAHGSLSDRLR